MRSLYTSVLWDEVLRTGHADLLPRQMPGSGLAVQWPRHQLSSEAARRFNLLAVSQAREPKQSMSGWLQPYCPRNEMSASAQMLWANDSSPRPIDSRRAWTRRS